MTARRTARFTVNDSQETLLRDVNSRLAAADASATASFPDSPQLPLVFVVGPPRSGTTLTMQWLADSRQFGYPSNFLARFYQAPYTGAQIQRLTHDPAYDFHGELTTLGAGSEWQSETGKTFGALAPHEFSYFWRRFFPMGQARRLDDEEWNSSDLSGFARGWAAMEAAFGLPIAAKGILGQYNVLQLAELLPTAVFIHTHRDPFFNVQSLLAARQRVYGSKDAWFSVQPPGYDSWRHLPPEEQVVNQVMVTNDELRAAGKALGPDRWIDQPYTQFCAAPESTCAALRRVFAAQGYDLEDSLRLEPFAATDEIRVGPEEEREIRGALDRWLTHKGTE